MRAEERAPLIKLPGVGRDSYSDGAVEDIILAGLCRGETPTEILALDRSWPALYHLSEVRRNLLEWFPFDPSSRVLEVGAGCGALTGLLCERTRAVMALELSRKRAEIIQARHQARRNLTIAVGNVRDLPIGEAFDLATLVGVLEYAPSFMSGPDPAATLLDVVGAHLAPGGTLLIAIENRFGLKYWAGASEDHTGLRFDGLEGYLRNSGVRTFSRWELEELLRRAGFPSARFFYPMPDYKLPECIYSEARPVQPGEIARSFPSWDRERLRLFDERAVLDGIAGSGAFAFFANSFLVVARRGGARAVQGMAPEDVILARYSRSRLPQYRIETRIVETGEGTVVRKRALEPSGAAHVAEIVAHHQALKGLAGLLRVPPAALRAGEAEVRYVAGTSLETILAEALLRRDRDGARAAVDVFARLVRDLSVASEGRAAFGDDGMGGPVLTSGILDLNLDNLIRDAAGVWWLIDVEWRRSEPVSAEFVTSRGLEQFLVKRHDLVAAVLDPQELFDRAGIDARRRCAFQAQELSFQVLVRGEELAFAVDPAFERPSWTLASVELERLEFASSLQSEREARSALEAGLARAAEETRSEREGRRTIEAALARSAEETRQARKLAEDRERLAAARAAELQELAVSLDSEREKRSALNAAVLRTAEESRAARALADERARASLARAETLKAALANADLRCRELQTKIDRIQGSRAWRLVSLYYAAWRQLGRR